MTTNEKDEKSFEIHCLNLYLESKNIMHSVICPASYQTVLLLNFDAIGDRDIFPCHNVANKII